MDYHGIRIYEYNTSQAGPRLMCTQLMVRYDKLKLILVLV